MHIMIASRIVMAPSILSADFTAMDSALALIARTDAEWIHCDVMDGAFVPHITFGHKMIADLRHHTDRFLDVHLMIEHPEKHVESFIGAGANAVTFHIEACIHAHRLVHLIKDAGCKAGISLVPSTPVSAIAELLADVDQVLVMSVNPGFGGQKFIPRSLERIRQLVNLRTELNANFLIAVDGGVNLTTAPGIRDAGADVLITGNAFFTAMDPLAELRAMRG